MDAVRSLAAGTIALEYEHLPASAIAASKRVLLDIVGTAFAGVDAEGMPQLRGVICHAYAAPGTSVWARKEKLPAPESALLNSAMAHALDFDDTHDRACLHAGASVIPAALSLAEEMGGISGKEFLAAITVGIDSICRMGLATTVPPNASGWMYTALYAYFGAAAAASRVLKLDLDRTVHAMGIAYAQAAGNTQCMPDGAIIKRIQPGFGARAGVLAALLSKSGITGAQNVFEGNAGLYNIYLKGEFDKDVLLADLGTRFEVENLSFKPYPSCRHTHTAIDAVLELLSRNHIIPEQIAEIRVGVNSEAYRNVCEPFEIKSKPRNVVDAQFSIPFCVSSALINKQVFVENFSDGELRNPRVLGLAGKVRAFLDEELEKNFGRQVSPATIRIRMKDGTIFDARQDYPIGSPEAPMSDTALMDKFRRCAQIASSAVSAQNAEKIIKTVQNLEVLSDVRELVELLVPSVSVAVKINNA